MAVVYRARDRKHDREVALKVLQPEVASAVGLKRFLREIRVAASLQHANIIPLYDSGGAGDILYYVMPFVEGPTLHERIRDQGPLSVEETLTITGEIADALDYAHAKGLVHRDIKPGNILFLNGHALLTDFGLATAVSSVEDERLTRTGTALGTPMYMSPEQASGKDIDRRSDVYSLGCVVYEMLAGDPPFTGSTVQAVLARHLSDPVPPIRSVRPQLQRGLDRTLTKALAKVPADRYASATELVAALRDPQVSAPFRRGSLAVVVAVLAMLSVGSLLLLKRPWDSSAKLNVGKSRPLTFSAGPEYSGSLSRDSKWVAYSHTAHGTMDLYIQLVEGGVPLRITEDAGDELLPRWSRDDKWLAYVGGNGAQCDIYRILPTPGSSPSKLVETRLPFLPSFWDAMMALGSDPWSPDGSSLIFSRRLETGEVAIFRVNIETGAIQQLTDPQNGAHDLSASWSFDGEQIVFARAQGGVSGLWLISQSGGDPRELLSDEFKNGEPSFMPGDQHIMFSSNRSGPINMWAVHVNSGQLSQLTSGGGSDQHPSVSKEGLIAYTQFSHQTDLHLLAVESRDSQKLTSWSKDNFGGRFSPDGREIAYHSTRDGDAEIWIRSTDPANSAERQLTDDSAEDVLPAWSPDGEWIAFLSNREGPHHLFVARADGSGRPRRVTDLNIPIPSLVWGVSLSVRWTPDGESIGVVVPGAQGSSLWVIDRDGSRKEELYPGVLRFDWYLDRTRIVYSTLGPDGLELRTANLVTKDDRVLHRGPHTELILAPGDGTAVAFVQSASHFNQRLYRLRLQPPTTADGLPSRLGDPEPLTDGQGRWHVHNGGWSHDGKWIVYTQDTDDGDIYQILNDE